MTETNFTGLTKKQKLILEYAYGRENPNFERPPIRGTYEIAGLVGVSHAYVSVILNGSYKINDLKEMYEATVGNDDQPEEKKLDGRGSKVKNPKKFTLSDKQEKILELAYGTVNPDFEKPALMSQFLIA